MRRSWSLLILFILPKLRDSVFPEQMSCEQSAKICAICGFSAPTGTGLSAFVLVEVCLLPITVRPQSGRGKWIHRFRRCQKKISNHESTRIRRVGCAFSVQNPSNPVLEIWSVICSGGCHWRPASRQSSRHAPSCRSLRVKRHPLATMPLAEH